MTFSKDKYEEVCDIIDSYTKDYLDNFIRDEIKSIVEPAIKAPDATKITVADAIFFKALKYKGNIVESIACEQIVPTETLHNMCADIANALK